MRWLSMSSRACATESANLFWLGQCFMRLSTRHFLRMGILATSRSFLVFPTLN